MIMECKVTARKSHYPKDVPFEVPEGWVWCQLKDICSFLSRGKSPVYSNTIREYPVFAQKCNLKEGGISLDKALFLDPITLPRWPEQYKLQNEDILVNSTGTGTVGRTRLFSSNCLGNYPFVVPDSHVSVIRTWENISSKYVLAVLSSEYGQHYIEDNLAGSTNQKELYIGVLEDFPIPIAPSNEQQYIAEKIDSLFDAIFQIDRTKENLEVDISAAKSRILDLAIHGKLVPQDNSEEPAIELLRHINPDFQPSHNLHYEGELPSGWALCCLEDVLEYEQPQAYIVNSTDYSDEYKTPVLTPGKSFVLGYTNDVSGICNHLPVIIFDDFTTESKYVDFPFKVKSSAMKILRSRGEIDLRYIAMYMSITRLAGDTHKRYWISEYSKIRIPIPPHAEQLRIIEKVRELFFALSAINPD